MAGGGNCAWVGSGFEGLLSRAGLGAISFPVSIGFRTNLAGVVFPSLVALLANFHGEKVPADPNVQEEVWRGLLVDYMTRPLPDGRSLVLTLHVVDQAPARPPPPPPFPPTPPPPLPLL